MEKLKFIHDEKMEHTSEMVGITNDQHQKLNAMFDAWSKEWLRKTVDISCDGPEHADELDMARPETINGRTVGVMITPLALLSNVTNNPAVEALGIDIANPNHCYWLGWCSYETFRQTKKVFVKLQMLIQLSQISNGDKEGTRKACYQLISDGPDSMTPKQMTEMIIGKQQD